MVLGEKGGGVFRHFALGRGAMSPGAAVAQASRRAR